MHTRRLATGIATFLPGVKRLSVGRTGGSDSARYCYSVWLRHLCAMHEEGRHAGYARVGELGPGDSLGLGLCAVICGASEYHALDIVAYADISRTRRMLTELADLFRRREPIPGPEEFPLVRPELRSYAFPEWLLPGRRLEDALSPERLEAIERALGARDAPAPAEAGGASEGRPVLRYDPDWLDAGAMPADRLDLILSQATLEHVDDLETTYRACARWLRPGGLMSHVIDFTAHGTARQWNGHYTFSDREWVLIRGRRPFLINRIPYSEHRRLLEANGFRILSERRTRRPTTLRRRQLAPRFHGMSDEDLATSGIHVLALAPTPSRA